MARWSHVFYADAIATVVFVDWELRGLREGYV
jgi:hypothetical protein